MSDLTLPYTIATGQQRSAAKVQANDEAIRDHVNGDDWVDSSKIADGVALSNLGDSRGKSIIVTEESRTNTAYGTLTTPDQVAGIVLPTDGLLVVACQALWKSSVANAGRATIYIGANQIQVRPLGSTAAPVVEETAPVGDANEYEGLISFAGGLESTGTAGGADATSDVTTGQILGGRAIVGSDTDAVGGPCYIFAAAGTYTVSLQFKSASGSVTAKERKLWVWAMGF